MAVVQIPTGPLHVDNGPYQCPISHYSGLPIVAEPRRIGTPNIPKVQGRGKCCYRRTGERPIQKYAATL